MDGSYEEENEPEISKAVAAARALIVSYFAWENSYCETPGTLMNWRFRRIRHSWRWRCRRRETDDIGTERGATEVDSRD